MAIYLIDTNVMLAASAVFNLLSTLSDEAMPEETELREIVFDWLVAFEKSDNGILLDEQFLIQQEYERNMPFNTNMHTQEYGLQVLQAKRDKCQDYYTTIETITGNGECIALLPEELDAIVTDREDRKWVATFKSMLEECGEKCPIVYAAESDWYKIEDVMVEHDVTFWRLLPNEWYENRHGGE